MTRAQRLPILPLLALGMAAFVTIVTETLPAGLLTRMADDLAITPAAAGQSVTVYAIGSFIAAIPLMSLLQGWRRRRLLLLTLAGFTLANTVTAFASNYWAARRAVSRVSQPVFCGRCWRVRRLDGPRP
jgi:predicted MFS family arabinose efflux permease